MRSWLTRALHWRRCSGSTQHSASTSCNCNLLVLAQLLVRLQDDLVDIDMRAALSHLRHLHVKLKTLDQVPVLGTGMTTNSSCFVSVGQRKDPCGAGLRVGSATWCRRRQLLLRMAVDTRLISSMSWRHSCVH